MFETTLRIAAALAAMQVVLWWLARGLARPLRKEVLAAGFLVPLLLLAPWLVGEALLVPTGALAGQAPGTLVPEGPPDPHGIELVDVVFQLLPWELEVRRAFGQGRLPLWSDTVDGGSSPWLNPQAAPLCPVALLARAVEIQHHYLAALALKLMVALQGAWVLLRRLGIGRAIALPSALAFAAGGGLATWGLFPHGTAIAWMPWLMAAAIALSRAAMRGAAARSRALRQGIVVAAVIGAAMLLSGQPEIALAAVVGAAVAVVAARHRPGWRGNAARAASRTAGSLLVAATLSAALAAPVLVPFALFLPSTARVADRVGPALEAGSNEEIVDRRPFTWFREYRGGFLVAPFHPWAFGRPYVDTFRGPISWTDSEAGYGGVLVAGMALAALALPRARRRAAVWLALAFALTLLAAKFRPLDALMSAVPLLRIPHWPRFIPLAALSMVIAAALGLEAWRRSRSSSRIDAVRWRAAIVFAVVAAGSLTFGWHLEVFVLWLLAGVSLLALAFGRVVGPGAGRWPAVGAGVLLLAIAVDLVPWARSFWPRGRAEHFYPRTEEVDALAAELAARPDSRVLGQDLLLYPNVASVYGLSDPRAHNPVAPRSQLDALERGLGFTPSEHEYTSPVRRLDPWWLDFLGVRAVVSNRYLPNPGGDLELFGPADRLTRLYRNPNPLPRFFVAHRVDSFANRGDLLHAIAAPDPDIARGVAVWGTSNAQGDLDAVVRWNPLSPGRVGLTLNRAGAQSVALIASSVPGPRGWTARSPEGVRLTTREVQGGYLGIEVPSEVDSIDLRFRPPGLVAGTGLALAGVCALILLGLGGVRLRLRARPLR